MGEIWVGVDVSKHSLDVAVRPLDQAWSVKNDQAGIKALTGKLKKLGPQRIVLEATGGYEYELAFELMKAGLPVAVVNPRQVRDFARAIGKLAKTDPVVSEYSNALPVRPPHDNSSSTTRLNAAVAGPHRSFPDGSVPGRGAGSRVLGAGALGDNG